MESQLKRWLDNFIRLKLGNLIETAPESNNNDQEDAKTLELIYRPGSPLLEHMITRFRWTINRFQSFFEQPAGSAEIWAAGFEFQEGRYSVTVTRKSGCHLFLFESPVQLTPGQER